MSNPSDHPVIICAGVVDPYLPGGSDGTMHTYGPGERLEGLPPEWAPLMHDLGVTMMQLDLPHVTTPEIDEGVWDWSKFDRWTQQYRQFGFPGHALSALALAPGLVHPQIRTGRQSLPRA